MTRDVVAADMVDMHTEDDKGEKRAEGGGNRRRAIIFFSMHMRVSFCLDKKS